MRARITCLTCGKVPSLSEDTAAVVFIRRLPHRSYNHLIKERDIVERYDKNNHTYLLVTVHGTNLVFVFAAKCFIRKGTFLITKNPCYVRAHQQSKYNKFQVIFASRELRVSSQTNFELYRKGFAELAVRAGPHIRISLHFGDFPPLSSTLTPFWRSREL